MDDTKKRPLSPGKESPQPSGIKLTLKPQAEPDPKRTRVEDRPPIIIKIAKPDKEVKEEPKPTKTMEHISKMQLDGDKEKIAQMIDDAKRHRLPGQVIVVNDARLSATIDNPTYLGHVVYTGAKSRLAHSNRAADLQLFLLPVFSPKHHYSIIEVRIPAEFLTYRGNIAVRKSALWGTEVYTDDSDVVAVIIHSGHYRPVDAPDPNPEDQITDRPPTEGAISPISSPVQPLVAEPDTTKSSSTILLPDHDLHVTLRILPRLVKYSGSTRFGLDSRGWGASHDGESISVVKVEKVERSSVGKKGRKVFAKRWGELAKPYTTEEEDEDITVVFSSVNGEACMKYTPKLMTEWPAHLNSQKTDVPFWQSKLTQSKCILEMVDGSRYELVGSNNVITLLSGNKELFSNINPEQISWGPMGLELNKELLQPGTSKVYWSE